jgi:CHAD domain-containing protein
VRDELGWLAALLGEVRDGDVLLERFRGKVAELPDDDQAGASALLATLESARDASHAQLSAALAGARYVDLVSTLVDAANDPALSDAASAGAVDTVPALVRKPWHRLDKRVRSLGAAPTDEQLHELRIHTKRVRYAADAVAPVVGKQARAFARAAAGLQEVLGDLNDAVVAASWLDAWAAGAREREPIRAARALAASERAAAASARAGWQSAWARLAAPEHRAWM